MEYKFKRGYKPDFERIRKILEDEFSCPVQGDGSTLTLNFGALKRITVWIDGNLLNVVTQSLPGADDKVVLDTNKRFRSFLEKATGYSAKERLKMAKKEAQGTD